MTERGTFMRIVTIHGERTLADVAQRVFQIKPSDTARMKLAVAALRAANPHLGARPALHHGAPLVVPDLEGAARSPAPGVASPLTADVAGRLRDALAAAA